ncbi:DUF397 domain-containing protein [Amycolatopsis sp. NPDC059657]|uniref:DUF397 domain-containing protein n=1 Tax=Amycolatopsis sp. NPDC059657 TaxID=3346899 RepID=UPI00366E0D5D
MTYEEALDSLGRVPDEGWFKSPASDEKGDCVEVCFLVPGWVAVRDSKNRARPAHLFTESEWNAFVAGVQAGAFDLAQAG